MAISAYPLNTQVTVHYNPDQPGVVVLELRVKGLGVLTLGILFTSASISIVIPILRWRSKRHTKKRRKIPASSHLRHEQHTHGLQLTSGRVG